MVDLGVNDEDKYAWLKEEKNYIRKVIEAGKAVLGICLGSQLIANALGNTLPLFFFALRSSCHCCRCLLTSLLLLLLLSLL